MQRLSSELAEEHASAVNAHEVLETEQMEKLRLEQALGDLQVIGRLTNSLWVVLVLAYCCRKSMGGYRGCMINWKWRWKTFVCLDISSLVLTVMKMQLKVCSNLSQSKVEC